MNKASADEQLSVLGDLILGRFPTSFAKESRLQHGGILA
jgi:hypothetical protein